MNAVAKRFAGQGVESIFLYTHEAHPAEIYPHLTSMEQKFNHAKALRDVLNVQRPILVDALDGACHRAYGSMPNMTWIFSRTGHRLCTNLTGQLQRVLSVVWSIFLKSVSAVKQTKNLHHSVWSAWTIEMLTEINSMKVLNVTDLKP